MSQAPNPPQPPAQSEPGLDAAQQSLSDALRVSFAVLKVLMVVLLVVYLCSGIFRVEEENMAVRYRFGEQIGTYGPGWHFGLPFPIEEIVTVPGKTQKLNLNKSFWYDNPEDKKPEDLAFQQLDPLKDSFLITGDTNVIHVQFGVDYKIKNDEVDEYLRNVGSLEQANALVQTAAEQAMIHYVASATIEEIITRGNFDRDRIKLLTQRMLDNLQAGIEVQQVLIGSNQSMPNQVREAYLSVTQAQADKAKTIQDARKVYNQTLGKAAGGAHTDLLLLIRAYEWALGSEQGQLAEGLRGVLDAAIGELRLPTNELLDRVRAYQEAATAAAGSDTPALQEQANKSSAALSKAIADFSAESLTGQSIAGEIASAISEARARRYQISNKAEQDYNRYASDLATYRKTPLLLASTRLQETREKVMADVLVQTIVGPITRINTNADPEVVEEIAEADLIRRREEAKRKAEEENR